MRIGGGHIEARRGSGLSQTAYCHQQGLNRKTFSVWPRRVEDD
ncbi:MAG: IS66 family insertion sequence element accessory protein TnpA [Methylococcaceae bacterium]